MTTTMVRDYPQLAALCWQFDDRTQLSGQQALAIYERNWRHVDQAALADDETQFIRSLVDEYGNGVLLV